MNKFKNLFIALRPWSFSASLTPVLLGSVLAYNKLAILNESFQFIILILTLLITICVHGAGNLICVLLVFSLFVMIAVKRHFFQIIDIFRFLR